MRRRAKPTEATELSASPLALVDGVKGGLNLTAVNAAAAMSGLMPGMPLADARALVPGLKTDQWQPGEDAKALARLAEWGGRYTPWSALDSIEGASGGAVGLLLDVTGCAHLFGGETALVSDLLAHLGRFGFAAQAGLADTPGAAWAVARFACRQDLSGPPWRIVPQEGQKAALASLPPAALRLSPVNVELLDRLGIDRIERLYGMPPAALQPRFGAELARRLRQALGEAPEPLSPLKTVPPHIARRIFAEPIMTPEDLSRTVSVLANSLCRQLEGAQQGARRLELIAYRVDGSLQRLALGISRPCRNPNRFERLFVEQLARIDPGFGIEVMTLAAPESEALSALQLVLRETTGDSGQCDPKNSEISDLVDRLSARFGSGAVFCQAPFESHLPERATRKAPALAVDGQPQSWVQGQARPLRLFNPPQPVEAVALLPDDPPLRFCWHRVQHKVARAEGPERIVPEWWSGEQSGAEESPRDYFRVEDDQGRRYWLYRAGLDWFLHGLFA